MTRVSALSSPADTSSETCNHVPRSKSGAVSRHLVDPQAKRTNSGASSKCRERMSQLLWLTNEQPIDYGTTKREDNPLWVIPEEDTPCSYLWSAANHGGGAPFIAQDISFSCGVSETLELLLVLLKSRWRGHWAGNSPT